MKALEGKFLTQYESLENELASAKERIAELEDRVERMENELPELRAKSGYYSAIASASYYANGNSIYDHKEK